MRTRTRAVVLIVAFVIVGGVLLNGIAQFMLPVMPASAQGNSNSFQTLLILLNERTKREADFNFTIVFAHPPNPTFAQASISSGGEFQIGEVGTDFVCIDRMAGTDLLTTCLPFTAIAGVGFDADSD